VTVTARKSRGLWALWVVQTTLLLTALSLVVGSISTIWLGQFSSDSSWWLVLGLPQVSIALVVVLVCWDRDSRPPNVGIFAGVVNMTGVIGAVVFGQWLVAVIGALTILALFVRPRDGVFGAPPPPRFHRLRARWSRQPRR
jgi:hypothetical protein